MTSARRKGIIISLLVALLLTTCEVGFGQLITGDILGTIHDSTGAVVPGARVILKSMDTGVTWEATSDTAGDYLFASLKPGRYSVLASKEGFQTATVSNIQLLIGQRPRVDVTLQVGAVTQTVEVSAGGVQLLDTQTSSAGQVITEKPIVDLPLSGRSYMNLTVLSVNVYPIYNANSPATSWTGLGWNNASIAVAGMRESNISYLVDGIESRNARFGSSNLHPSIDALQEFKMQTNAFSAEYGRSSAVMNAEIKGGTNTLHGNLYEFARNSAYQANNFFYNAQRLPIPQYTQNDFGGTLGGPIVRNKAFFFLSYEGFRSRAGITGQGTVPSAAQWQGNLADNSAGTGIFPTASCPTGVPKARCVDLYNPFTGAPFTGNVIPSGLLDAKAQIWKNFTPSPNVASAVNSLPTPVYNYHASPKVRNDFNNASVRMDESLRSKDQFHTSYTFVDIPHISPSVMPLGGSSYPLRSQVASLTEDHIFSPQVVNEFRMGYNRGKTFLVGQGALGPNYAVTLFGLTNTSLNPFDYGVPRAGMSGFSTPGSPAESIGSIDQDFQWVDNLSVVHGKHSLKVGVNLIRERFFQITDFGGVPSFSFTGQFTGKYADGSPANGSFSSMADMLLGIPDSGTASVGNSAQELRTTFIAPYVQDDWRVRPNLTVNAGIRYEYANPPWDKYNHTEWFNPQIGQIQYSDLHQVRNGIINPDHASFAPRLGIAYSPRALPNTVFRAAGGVFFSTDNWNELQFMVNAPRYFFSQTLTSSPTTPTLSIDSLFPAPGAAPAAANPFSLEQDNRNPYVMEWNFDVQHAFRTNWLVDVGYAGNRGVKLPQRNNLNGPTFDPTGTVPLANREPWPNFSFILWGYNGGWSSDNALTGRVEHRTAGGLYFLGSYTYAKCLDIGNTDDFSMVNFQNNIYMKGHCDYDVTQRLVLSDSYALPVGKGKRYLGGINSMLNMLVGGWNISGITTFSTGQYTNVTLPGNWMNMGSFTTTVPNKVGPLYPAQQTIKNWYDINAFAYPGCPSYVPCTTTTGHIEGNAGRHQIPEPGINNWDFALRKETAINERFNTEFRAEFFNGWNHPQWSTPSTSLSPGTFGVISGLLIPARQIQFGLKLLW